MSTTPTPRRGLAQGLLLAVLLAASAARAGLPVTEHVLANGMRFLIIEDHTAPTFMGAWVAHVGSSNETPGQTGVTHLLEHMMFKGTRVIGTKDLGKDLDLIDRQEGLMEALRTRSRDLLLDVRQGKVASLAEAQQADAECRRLEDEFKQLVTAQRENMIPNEFDQIMQKNGELFGNAFTSQDMTAYFNVLPANKLELWFWMESDRLINPVFREFYAERDVVYEERRMRTEATPTGIHEEAVNSLFWQASPYHWPIIGWPSDVAELSMPQAQAYYHTWYGPGNITGILAGDFSTRDAIKLAERYFGRMEARPAPPALVTLEPPQLGQVRYTGEVEINPTVNFRYHCGGFKHVDSGTLQVLASLLSGDTGRLQRKLVEEQHLAVRAWAYYERMKHEGAFQVEAEAAQGVDNAMLEAALEAELRRLADEAVPVRELQKIKNTFFVDTYREQQNAMRAGFELISNAGMGDWREQEAFSARIQAVTAEDVQRLARQILRKENRMVTWWVRKEGSQAAAEPEGLSTLPAEMQEATRQMLARMKQVTDTAALAGLKGQLEANPGSNPNEVTMNRLLLEAVDARLKALESQGGAK